LKHTEKQHFLCSRVTHSEKEMVLLGENNTRLQDKASSQAQKSENPSTSTDGKSTVTIQESISSKPGNGETQMVENTMVKKAVTFVVTTTPPAQPIKLLPKEWWALHDEWLNSTMRAEMEDESVDPPDPRPWAYHNHRHR